MEHAVMDVGQQGMVTVMIALCDGGPEFRKQLTALPTVLVHTVKDGIGYVMGVCEWT